MVSGLNPNHYEIVLENTKEGLLTIIQDLVSQFPNEVFPFLPRVKGILKGAFKGSAVNMDRYLQVLETVGCLANHYGAGVLDLLTELYFGLDPLQESLLTLTRLLLAKTDRTVIDLSDKLQKTKQLHQNSSVWAELDAEVLEGWVSRALKALIDLTSTATPWMLTPV